MELGTPPGTTFFFPTSIPGLNDVKFVARMIRILLLLLNSQVIYELKAGGVDQRRLVGAKLEKLAEGESGNVKMIDSV